jgi:hypothetical protein
MQVQRNRQNPRSARIKLWQQRRFPVLKPSRLPTQSKTRQAPGDDDPDIARESLY